MSCQWTEYRKDVRGGGMRTAVCLGSLAVLLCLTARTGNARQQTALPMTQRRINEMAASMETARRALIEDAGLRRPGEDLTLYLRRIALPVPGETPARYKTRITGYLALFAHSADATQNERRLPTLHDTGAFNRAQWDKAIRALQILPARVRKTRTAWERAQIQTPPGTPKNNTSAFDVELAETVGVLIAADDGLRDAKP